MRRLSILALFGLAACGAAGAPERPGPDTEPGTGSGVRVSGTASIGIAGGG